MKGKVIYKAEQKHGVSVAMILCIVAFLLYNSMLIAERINSGEFAQQFEGFDLYYEQMQ